SAGLKGFSSDSPKNSAESRRPCPPRVCDDLVRKAEAHGKPALASLRALSQRAARPGARSDHRAPGRQRILELFEIRLVLPAMVARMLNRGARWPLGPSASPDAMLPVASQPDKLITCTYILMYVI